MKVRNHLPHAGNAARHRAHHIQLVPIVDPHVGISRPDQHSIDPAIALVQVIQIAVDCVLPRHRIIEIPVMHHHLRLKETRLRPFERRRLIPRRIVPNANPPLRPPVRHIREPLLVRGVGAGLRTTLPSAASDQAIRRRNLLSPRRVMRVLSSNLRERHSQQYEAAHANKASGEPHRHSQRPHSETSVRTHIAHRPRVMMTKISGRKSKRFPIRKPNRIDVAMWQRPPTRHNQQRATSL